jgi:phosphate transport system substrate-binding protein
MHHNPQKRRALLPLALLVMVSLTTAACGDDGESTTADPSTTPDETPAGDLEGDFLVSGSSTVFPIVQRQAEEFGAANGGVAIAVEGPGSGDGARKFCVGEVPIANASRLFEDEEIEICEAAGIEFIEIRRGIDGISVVTSAENDAIECVSFNDLYALISEEAFGFESWADANALTAEWGGTEFPDARLELFGPGEESGTFDSFGEIVIESVAKGKTGLDTDARELVDTIRPDYTASPNDNVIIEGIGSSQYSLGWVGYAFAQEAADAGSARLLQVAKEDGGECVTPTPETIADASFPIARFLYTYVNVESAANEPAVTAFVDYMMSDAGLESVSAVGYVDLAAADQALAQAIWENRTTGRSWG